MTPATLRRYSLLQLELPNVVISIPSGSPVMNP